MAAYYGVDVTFLGNNKVRVTWQDVGGALIFKQKGVQYQYSPTAEVISGSGGPVSTSGLVALANGGGEMVLTYPSAVNLTAIGYNASFANFADWMRMDTQAADAEFDSKSAYVWEPSQSTPLSTPTGLYADNITSDSARISWNAVENANGYKVEYRQSAGGGQTYPWIEASD